MAKNFAVNARQKRISSALEKIFLWVLPPSMFFLLIKEGAQVPWSPTAAM